MDKENKTAEVKNGINVVPGRFHLYQLQNYRDLFLEKVLPVVQEFSNACDRNNEPLASEILIRLADTLEEAASVARGTKKWDGMVDSFIKK